MLMLASRSSGDGEISVGWSRWDKWPWRTFGCLELKCHVIVKRVTGDNGYRFLFELGGGIKIGANSP